MQHQAFLEALSVPRIGVYRQVFRTRTDEETSGAVFWGQTMAMALQPLMTIFEVVLRNRIHASLSRQAAAVTTALSATSCAWYDHQLTGRQLNGETFDKVEKLLNGPSGGRLATQPSPDRVIAALSFGVWPNVLDAQLATPVMEVTTFQDVFPYHAKASKHWRYAPNRKDAVARVKDIQNWRNRLAHCKPVWSEGWYRANPAPHWTDMLSRLKGRRQDMLDILAWMSPDATSLYRQSLSACLFDQLIKEETVAAHIFRPVNPCTGLLYTEPDAFWQQQYRAR